MVAPASDFRSARLPLGLAAVLVIAGLVLLSHPPPPTPAPAPAPGPTPASAGRTSGVGPAADRPPSRRQYLGSPSPSPRALPSGAPSSAPPRREHPAPAGSGVPVNGDGPAGDRAVQRMLERSSPADLPRSQEEELVQVATRVWTADVTGRGQGRWPRYFAHSGASARGTYTAVRVQAGIARTTADGRIEVRLVWAGTAPSGEQRDGRTARLLLQHSPDHPNRWEPVH
ncbi:hypothetical protein ACIBK8_28545 [Streptomyces sp. NPDC050161]|uniref:hypothetical protein n=1 Tax=Streptomyces sp. NPDC050161 TaxID=3365604 RepID=UPI0037A80385